MLSQRKIIRLVYMFVFINLKSKHPWSQSWRIQMSTNTGHQGQCSRVGIPLVGLFLYNEGEAGSMV